MVKRPLVCLLAAFVLGCFLGSVSFPFVVSILILVVIWLGVCLQQKWMTDRFVIILPVVIFLGCFLMNNQMKKAPLDLLFEDNIMGSMEGEIYELIKTDTYTKIFLKEVIIKIFDDTNAESQSGTKEKNYYCNKILVYNTESTNLKVGNQVFVYGEINKFQRATNLGQFDEYQFYKTQNIDYKVYAKSLQVTNASFSQMHSVLERIKEKLEGVYRNLLSEKEAGIISAMLLGSSKLLDQDTKELYQKNGIAHILAISGLHITLIGMCFFKVFEKLKLPIFLSISFTIILIFLYGILTNFSVSTNRAVVMLVIALLAKIIGKTYDIMSAISLSALVILIQTPLQLYSCGFLLSFGAILGIAIVLPALEALLQSKNHQAENKAHNVWVSFQHSVKSSFLVSISVTLMTLPILLYFFFQVPLYSILLNLIVIPLMTLVVMLSMVGGILGCFNLVLGRLCIGGVHYILVLYESLCRFFEQLPYSTILVGKPSEFHVLCYYAMLAIILFACQHHQKKKYAAVLLGLFLLFLQGRRAELEITFLDVGQGDGIFFETPSNTTYLIDGGSSDVKQVGKYRLRPYLLAKGIQSIDYAIVTHVDADHISGLIELMEEIEIGMLLMPDTSLITQEYTDLIHLAQTKHIDVKYLEKGDAIVDGDVTLSCLHPYFEYQPETNNDYSTVIRIDYGEFQALLTGDLGNSGEKLLLGEIAEYDVLKVAHHGSKNSSCDEFIEKISPNYAIISCGRNNRYGHPHQEVLDRLFKNDSKTYITSQSGAITIRVTEGKLRLYEYNSEK